MIDVALAAGVSQTTVSLVLNNSLGARLSTATRQRVRDAARDLGYRLPRHAPAAPDPVGSTVIGFISDEISTDPWCALQLDGVRERAWENGLTVVAGVYHSDAALEAALLDQLLRPAAGRADLRHHPHPADPAAAAVLPGADGAAELLRAGPLARLGGAGRAARRLCRDACT